MSRDTIDLIFDKYPAVRDLLHELFDAAAAIIESEKATEPEIVELMKTHMRIQIRACEIIETHTSFNDVNKSALMIASILFNADEILFYTETEIMEKFGPAAYDVVFEDIDDMSDLGPLTSTFFAAGDIAEMEELVATAAQRTKTARANIYETTIDDLRDTRHIPDVRLKRLHDETQTRFKEVYAPQPKAAAKAALKTAAKKPGAPKKPRNPGA